ncbi:hypothetical protein MXB_1109, partial [Myxobolus squamalis]
YFEYYTKNRPNICIHFVCALPFGTRVQNVYYLVLNKDVCIIPMEHNRKGILSSGPDYMHCSTNENKSNSVTDSIFIIAKYCSKSRCVLENNLTNCQNGICSNL